MDTVNMLQYPRAEFSASTGVQNVFLFPICCAPSLENLSLDNSWHFSSIFEGIVVMRMKFIKYFYPLAALWCREDV